jgi:hypothetical protein
MVSMTATTSRKALTHVWPGRPLWDQSPQQLARAMVQIFGTGAAGKAIEMTRMQTESGNRDAAVKWQRVMSLIEESRRTQP